jgi:hypothetical protein
VTGSSASDDVAGFLARNRTVIVDGASDRLRHARAPHYASADAEEVRARLDILFGHVVDAVATRDLSPLETYAEEVANERFEGGYDLAEVQTAFNAIEEATWARVLADLQPASFANALGLVTTVVGAGKDALARAYVSRAARTHAPTLNLLALFGGAGADEGEERTAP